jgi:hypothetical protein
MGDGRVICIADAARGPYASQHNFLLFVVQRCALCRKFIVLLLSPVRHSVLVPLILLNRWLVLNTPTSLCGRTTNIPGD